MRFLIMLLPWLELFTLIKLGTETSALTALVYVFGTLVLGLAILRRQGQGVFERLRESREGRIVGPDLLLDDMATGFAGLLLVIPGMITDFMALLVLVGPLRRRVARAVSGPQPEPYIPRQDSGQHETIEGTFRRIDDDESL